MAMGTSIAMIMAMTEAAVMAKATAKARAMALLMMATKTMNKLRAAVMVTTAAGQYMKHLKRQE